MRNVIGKLMAAVSLCVAYAFSDDADSVSLQAVPSLDLLKASADSIANADSVKAPDSSASAVSSAPLKTVLYLGGGERSPWFQLGVLYGIEEYGIPVDSVVATSWGAWIASLWTRGVPLDDIQKLMLDSAIVGFVGHDLSAIGSELGYRKTDSHEVPVSVSGIPSIRSRFAIMMDTSCSIRTEKKSLTPDSMQVVRALAKLRFQESLYRQRQEIRIPFAVQSCESGTPVVVGNSVSQVIASLPLWGNDSAGMSGEGNTHGQPAGGRGQRYSALRESNCLC